MKDVTGDAKKEETPVVVEKKVNPRVATLHSLRQNITNLEKGVAAKERTLIVRVTRSLSQLRKKIDGELLQIITKENLSSRSDVSSYFSSLISSTKEKEEVKKSEGEGDEEVVEFDTKPEKTLLVPEVEAYIQLLLIGYLIDNNRDEAAAEVASDLSRKVLEYNRRTLDHLSARAYFFFALTHERLGRLDSIRNALIVAHRTACLHHDEPGQVSLSNAILRSYLDANLYAQADRFRLKTTLPDSGSTGQYARFLYYSGRIEAIQLHYSKALNSLNLAIRKAPREGAIGFRQTVTKLLVIVQLLLGEIPDRSVFRQTDLKRSLKPYFQLTKAIRGGDIAFFKETMEKYNHIFLQDKNFSLIVRLRHNVIKTGLRNINLSYSRISLSDVASKLHLEDATDAEYIVAKAISDGVINATIDRESASMFSNENVDIYSTQEPQNAFHKRIQFCMDVHTSAVKSLRFPEHAPKKVESVDEDEIDVDDEVIVEEDDED